MVSAAAHNSKTVRKLCGLFMMNLSAWGRFIVRVDYPGLGGPDHRPERVEKAIGGSYIRVRPAVICAFALMFCGTRCAHAG
jgi:hypothetical protein